MINIFQLDPKVIPRHAFRDRMRHLRSYRDIVRIFYGEYLTDQVVDEMLTARRVETILPYQEMVFDDSQIMDQIHGKYILLGFVRGGV